MDILWIVVQIVASSFGIVCVLALTKWRFSRRVTFMAAAGFIICMTAVNFQAVLKLSYLLEPYPILDFVYRFSNILLAVGLVCVLTRQRAAQMMFTVLSACACVLTVDTIAITLRVCLGMYPAELLLELVVYSLMVWAVITMRAHFLEITDYVYQKRVLHLLCIIPALLTACFFLLISAPVPLSRAPEHIPAALVLCLVTAAFYGVYFAMFRMMNTQHTLEQNVMAMRLYASALEHQNAAAVQSDNRLRLFKHDIRHIGQMISVSLEKRDAEAIRKLLTEMDVNVRDTEGDIAAFTITGHRLLDTTLSYYINLARDADIQFTTKMERMDGIRTDIAELAVVFSNALENAVNACMALQDGTQRSVHVNGCWRGKQYFIEFINTCDGNTHFDTATGLPLRAGDGYGLGSQSIAYFADKHNAVLQYHLDGPYFHMQLLI